MSTSMLGTLRNNSVAFEPRTIQVIAYAEHLAVDHHLEAGPLLYDFCGFKRPNVGFEAQGAQVLFDAASWGQSDVIDRCR